MVYRRIKVLLEYRESRHRYQKCQVGFTLIRLPEGFRSPGTAVVYDVGIIAGKVCLQKITILTRSLRCSKKVIHAF